jgi:hypothetical protein
MQIIEETYGLFELPVNEGKQKLQVQVWKPPEPGWVKVNTDGSLNISSREAGSFHWAAHVLSSRLGFVRSDANSIPD